MQQHLDLCGDAWDERQAAAACKADAGGGPCTRELRGVVAARMELEEFCLKQIAMLMHEPGLWATLPERALTVRHRCLAFRMLSMVGCCVEELLRKQHRRVANETLSPL